MTRTHRRTTAAAPLALALVLALGACTGGDGGEGAEHSGHGSTGSPGASSSTSTPGSSPTSTPPGSPESVSPEHSAADVAFARDMLEHHQGALDMAALAPERAQDPEVRALAAQIADAQQREMAEMAAWLEVWGEEAAAPGGDGHDDHGSGGQPMAGMGPQERAALEAARDTAFDRLFLDQMGAHHREAVEMARVELTEGQNTQAVALARRVEQEQTEELARMAEIARRLP